MSIKSGLTCCLTALFIAGPGSAIATQCENEVWHQIMARGSVVVGVKADYKPWGFRNAKNEIVGMEIDLAQAAADAMGVRLETVAVQASNRMQLLSEGQIDMLIATMSDRPDRRQIVGVVQPNYYTSGTNIMAPRSLGLSDWEELRGQPVCGKQGAFYNHSVVDRYGVKLVAFAGDTEAKQALRNGECVAWVYDDSSIGSDLASGEFEEFEMPLASEDDNPWALAVPLAEKNCIFGHFMSGLTFNLHQSGQLIELEKKWGIKASEYLQDKFRTYTDWLSLQ